MSRARVQFLKEVSERSVDEILKYFNTENDIKDLLTMIEENRDSLTREERENLSEKLKKALEIVKKGIWTSEKDVDVLYLPLPPKGTLSAENYEKYKELLLRIDQADKQREALMMSQLRVANALKGKVHPEVQKFVMECLENRIDDFRDTIKSWKMQISDLKKQRIYKGGARTRGLSSKLSKRRATKKYKGKKT